METPEVPKSRPQRHSSQSPECNSASEQAMPQLPAQRPQRVKTETPSVPLSRPSKSKTTASMPDNSNQNHGADEAPATPSHRPARPRQSSEQEKPKEDTPAIPATRPRQSSEQEKPKEDTAAVPATRPHVSQASSLDIEAEIGANTADVNAEALDIPSVPSTRPNIKKIREEDEFQDALENRNEVAKVYTPDVAAKTDTSSLNNTVLAPEDDDFKSADAMVENEADLEDTVVEKGCGHDTTIFNNQEEPEKQEKEADPELRERSEQNEEKTQKTGNDDGSDKSKSPENSSIAETNPIITTGFESESIDDTNAFSGLRESSRKFSNGQSDVVVGKVDTNVKDLPVSSSETPIEPPSSPVALEDTKTTIENLDLIEKEIELASRKLSDSPTDIISESNKSAGDEAVPESEEKNESKPSLPVVPKSRPKVLKKDTPAPTAVSKEKTPAPTEGLEQHTSSSAEVFEHQSAATSSDSLSKPPAQKKPPPKVPKKPSSRIAQFQEMLEKQQKADLGLMGVPKPRPHVLLKRPSIKQEGSTDSAVESSTQGEEKEVPAVNKLQSNFTQSLNGMIGMGLPGMAFGGNPYAAIQQAKLAKLSSEEGESEPAQEKSENPIKDVRRGRAKGPRGRKLPSGVSKEVEVNDSTLGNSLTVVVKPLWSLDFRAPVQEKAEPDLAAGDQNDLVGEEEDVEGDKKTTGNLPNVEREPGKTGICVSSAEEFEHISKEEAVTETALERSGSSSIDAAGVEGVDVSTETPTHSSEVKEKGDGCPVEEQDRENVDVHMGEDEESLEQGVAVSEKPVNTVTPADGYSDESSEQGVAVCDESVNAVSAADGYSDDESS